MARVGEVINNYQPREKFWRDKRGATERSELTSEGGVRGSSSGKFQKPTLQMVQSTLFLSYIFVIIISLKLA